MENEIIDIDHLLSQYKTDDIFYIDKNHKIILANWN